MTSYAQQLRNELTANAELARLRAAFAANPNGSVETSLSYSQAQALGFRVSSSQFGTYVSLPPAAGSSQYGDH